MLTGSALRFEIWKEYSDDIDWNKYIEYFQREPEFGEEKSKKLIEIYSFLKKELGKNYLEKCHRDGRNLVNFWLWNQGSHYSELLWLYESLKHCKSKTKDCNYEKLRGRLQSNAECNRQGIPFLIAGDSLRKAGFEVVFEPAIDFIKKPDLKIVNPHTQEIIFCEISKLEDSNATKNGSDIYHFLMEKFRFKTPIIPFAGKIQGLADEEQVKEVGNYILQIKEKAYKENLFIVVDCKETHGVIEFAVGHPDKEKEVVEWAKLKKCRGLYEIVGLPLNLDYTARLLSKIKDEVKQLPSHLPGIIYVPLPPLFFFFGILDPLKMVDSVQWELSKYPNLTGIFLYAHIGHESEPMKVELEGNYFERKIVHGNIQQDVLFVVNKEFNSDLVTSDTFRKLYSSFGNIFQ